MWRETGRLRIGILCVVSVFALACGTSNRKAESADTVDDTAAAPPPSSAHELDVNMSFAEDETESEDEEEATSRYAPPPPTKTYSPSNKMSAAEKPGDKPGK